LYKITAFLYKGLLLCPVRNVGLKESYKGVLICNQFAPLLFRDRYVFVKPIMRATVVARLPGEETCANKKGNEELKETRNNNNKLYYQIEKGKERKPRLLFTARDMIIE